MRKVKLAKQKKKTDRKLLALSLTLTGIGLIAVADASAPQALSFFSDKLYFLKQQAVWGLIGVAALIIASKVHYSFWKKIATPLFILTIILLILVLIPGIGGKALGARRWIILGPVSFQPSEIIKLTLAIYLAKVSSKEKKALSYFTPIALVIFLIMLQPDFGTALVIGAIGMVEVFVSGVSLLYFAGALGIGGILGFLLVFFSDYRKQRLLTFIKVTQDPLGKSYHIRQILLALGSGGIFGVGLGQSRQKYLFLPEAATDSIFAIIAEELGFIGGTILIGIFIWLVYRGLKITRRAPDKFSKILAVGIVTWIGGQAFLNIGSMVALVPLTGIPLPFISYGGSALTMVLLSIGILLNISKYGKKER